MQVQNGVVPQAWMEWIWSLYSPDEFIIQPQAYGLTLAPTAAQLLTGNVQFPNPFYCFSVRSCGVVTATGARASVLYRFGVKNAAGNDWQNGNWLAPITSGDNGAAPYFAESWTFPREIVQNEVLTVTNDNTLTGAVGLTIDTVFWGYEVRIRNNKVKRG